MIRKNKIHKKTSVCAWLLACMLGVSSFSVPVMGTETEDLEVVDLTADGGVDNEVEFSGTAYEGESDVEIVEDIVDPSLDGGASEEGEASGESVEPEPADVPQAEQAAADTDGSGAVIIDFPTQSSDQQADAVVEDTISDEYALKKVVVFSRHNIRAPMSGEDSLLSRATNYEWFDWTSATQELSIKGGQLETAMGQYFRKWLADEGLFEENYVPQEGEVRFYANAKQRTIATARYFSAGFMPLADIPIETHAELGGSDPTFKIKVGFTNDAYDQIVNEELAYQGVTADGTGIDSGMEPAYQLLEQVVDLQNSEAYLTGELTGLTVGNSVVSYNAGEKPGLTGSLDAANTLSDALVLQYYETGDPVLGAFGQQLTEDQWKLIASGKDQYNRVLFGTHSLSVNTAHVLLGELLSEIRQEGREFTFICGHDSNILNVLTALSCEPYELPQTIEQSVPIGAKLVFEIRENTAGEQFCDVNLVYQSLDQLLTMEQLTLNNPPVKFPIAFEGLQRNEDGLYSLADIEARFEEALAEYEELAALGEESEAVEIAA